MIMMTRIMMRIDIALPDIVQLGFGGVGGCLGLTGYSFEDHVILL